MIIEKSYQRNENQKSDPLTLYTPNVITVAPSSKSWTIRNRESSCTLCPPGWLVWLTWTLACLIYRAPGPCLIYRWSKWIQKRDRRKKIDVEKKNALIKTPKPPLILAHFAHLFRQRPRQLLGIIAALHTGSSPPTPSKYDLKIIQTAKTTQLS